MFIGDVQMENIKFNFENDSGLDPVFRCPNCGYETSNALTPIRPASNNFDSKTINDHAYRIVGSNCRSCNEMSIWLELYHSEQIDIGELDKYHTLYSFGGVRSSNSMPILDKQILLFPDNPAGVPNPIKDMPSSIKDIYKEAASIANKSPRAAAALLRLALEKLLKDELEVKGKSLNERIKNLYSSGAPGNIIKIMDIIRITGNDGIHDGNLGVIDIEQKDNFSNVIVLFNFINYLVDQFIVQPQKINAMVDNFSQGQKNGIARRKK